MKRCLLMLAVLACCVMCPAVASAQADEKPKRARVKATGQAPVDLPNAREAAVEDALRRCVEAGGGVELASATKSKDFTLVSDVIYTKTAGYVQRYEVLQENPDLNGLYTVKVEAIIKTGSIDADLMAWKALLKRKGRPRLMVVGSVDGTPFESMQARKMRSILERRGVTAIHAEMLDERQRRDADRVARGEGDAELAAHIAAEFGADYLVILDVQGHALPPENVYGQTNHRAQGEGSVEIVRPDTALTLASEVVNGSATAANAPEASRRLIEDLLSRAMNQAIKRLAVHWLEDVDQREGQQIEVVFYRFPTNKVHEMIARIRQVDGMREVHVDAIDSKGPSRVRVVTNSSAADVGYVLQGMDPSLNINSTRYRLEITQPAPADQSKSIISTGLNDTTMIVAVGSAIGVVVIVLIVMISKGKQRQT